MPLGRGLSSLIPPWKQFPQTVKPEMNEIGSSEVDTPRMFFVSPELIDPNPYQPRDTFPHGSMEELINSVRKYGILEPMIATQKTDGRYELIAGERRLRAAKFLNLKTVPVLLRQADDLEKLELSLIENLQRQDLNSIEEAEGYRQLMDAFNLTQEEAAKRVGKSREAVANALRLLSLPGEMQMAIASGKITATHGRLLLQVENSKERQNLFEQILKGNLTIKEAEIKGGTKIKRRHLLSFKDPKMTGYEESLREALGTKVLVEKRGEKGKIVIEFYSDEELDGIIRSIVK